MENFSMYYNALLGFWIFSSEDGEIQGTGNTQESCIEQIDLLTEPA